MLQGSGQFAGAPAKRHLNPAGVVGAGGGNAGALQRPAERVLETHHGIAAPEQGGLGDGSDGIRNKSHSGNGERVALPLC